MTNAERREIWRRWWDGEPERKLAEDYGVSRSAIQHAIADELMRQAKLARQRRLQRRSAQRRARVTSGG